nr:hypothetical protein [Tanacetum cinerariifolium]
NILIHGTCLKCNSGAGNSFTYDPIPESFSEVQIIPDPPSQFHFNIYLCQIYPLIDHHCCYECGNSLNDFFCHQCTCEFCRNGAHVGYNFPTQVPSFQTLPSFPQQYPCCEDCGILPEANHCQTSRYTVNHPIFNAHNDLLTSQTTLMEQMTQLTSMCEMFCQIIQVKQEEKRIEEEQAAKDRYWKIPACCDDDDDYNFAITPNEPVYSLIMGDEHLDTIPATELDEFIKSWVENLIPNLSESEDENGCDLLACFTTFSNILFEVDYESDSKSMLNHDSSIIPSSSKIDSLLDEFAGELTLLKSIPPGIDKTDRYPEEGIHLTERLLYDNSSPRPPKEFVSENSNAEIESFSPSPIPNDDSGSHMKEIDLSFNPDDQMSPSIEEDDDDDDSERDILIHGNTGILNIKMMGDISDQKVPMPRLMITRVSNQEKSPDLLSHRSLENFQLSSKCPMMIYGKNIPILNVPLFLFYPLDQLKYGGN